MTYTELASKMADLCETANIKGKYVYYQYPVGLAPEPPYIIYWTPDRDDFRADNSNYVKIATLVVELYTNTKDPALETAIENWFESQELAPYIEETFLDDEAMHETIYTMEVIIDGEQSTVRT